MLLCKYPQSNRPLGQNKEIYYDGDHNRRDSGGRGIGAVLAVRHHLHRQGADITF